MMEYKINYNEWGSLFSLPASVVDKHIKLCSETQIKVLLYIMRNSQTLPSQKEISQALSVSEDEADNAVSFWIERNILYTDVIREPEKEQIKPKERPKVKRILRPDSHYVAKKLKEDRDLRDLLDEAQQVFNKTLSPNDISTLVYLSDSLGLPYAVIVMILHYCRDIDRCNISYVEKIGKEWSDEEIFDLASAEEKIKEMTDRNEAWNTVSRLFGLKTVSRPSKNQVRYAYVWLFEWNMGKDLISEAYDRCMDVKGAFDMTYINGILRKWNEKSIRTVEQLKSEESKKQTKKKSDSKNGTKSKKGSVYSSDTASYDLDDYEKKSIFDED